MTKSVYLVFGLLLLGISEISAASKGKKKTLLEIVHDECVEKTGVTEEMITDCASGKFADDQRLKCYMNCWLVEGYVVNPNTGAWNFKVLEIIIPDEYKEVSIPVVRECGVVKGADICDTAFQTNKCWQSKLPGIYRLV